MKKRLRSTERLVWVEGMVIYGATGMREHKLFEILESVRHRAEKEQKQGK